VRITLDDVAAKAHVSKSTVSRVLNDYPYVDEVTRNHVWEVARQLGYRLNNLRHRPHMGNEHVLLLLEQENQMPNNLEFTSHVSRGLRHILESKPVQLKHAYVGNRIYLDYVDGVILLGGSFSDECIQSINSRGIPCVTVGGYTSDSGMCCVMADYGRGIEKAVQYLKKSGRKTIGLVNGPNTTTTSQEKLKGFSLSLILNGLPYSSGQIVSADFTYASGYQGGQALLNQCPDIDAIICGDDYIALGVMQAVQDHGYRTPMDVAVIGLHNFQIAEEQNITSIALDMELMGTLAARRIWTMIEESFIDCSHSLAPTDLVLRESA